MQTVTKTLAELTEEALANLYRLAERPATIILDGDNFPSTTDTTFTLLSTADEDKVNIAQTVEFDRELMLVRDKSGSPGTKLFTVIRGYGGSTAATHGASSVGLVNPPYARWRVQQAILRSLTKLDVWAPRVISGVFNRAAGFQYIALPANTMEVFQVTYFDRQAKLKELGGWRFFDDMPTSALQLVGDNATSITPTAQMLRLPWGVQDTDDLVVTYQLPWGFSSATPAEIDTAILPRGGDNIPSSYAAAYLAARREIGRLELDKAEEFNKLVPPQSGQSVAVIRDLWQQFYREMDEARRIYRPPTHRPWRIRPRGF